MMMMMMMMMVTTTTIIKYITKSSPVINESFSVKVQEVYERVGISTVEV